MDAIILAGGKAERLGDAGGRKAEVARPDRRASAAAYQVGRLRGPVCAG